MKKRKYAMVNKSEKSISRASFGLSQVSSKLIALLLPALAAVSLFQVPAEAKIDENSLKAAVEILKRETRVPVRIPAYVNEESAEDVFYAVIISATFDSYELHFDWTPDCGGTACHASFISGEKITARSKRPRGKRVALAGGKTAYYEESSCGASCGDDALVWDAGGFRYTVGSKAGDLESARKMAESAGVAAGQEIKIAALKNPDVVDGCSCGFQTAAEARKPDSRKWLFLSELGSGEAFMNIDGRDTKLKLVKTTEKTGRRARVGQRFYEEYAAPGVKVRVDYLTKKVCPPEDESCEVIDYDVTITVTRGKSSKTVKAVGSCGC